MYRIYTQMTVKKLSGSDCYGKIVPYNGEDKDTIGKTNNAKGNPLTLFVTYLLSAGNCAIKSPAAAGGLIYRCQTNAFRLF